MNVRGKQFARILAFVPTAALILSSLPLSLLAQTTVSTGSIVGTISDPSGAVLSGAKVTITNTATGQAVYLATNSSGSFSSGALVPGQYKTFASAKGFRSSAATVTVLVGNTTTVNMKLQIGSE